MKSIIFFLCSLLVIISISFNYDINPQPVVSINDKLSFNIHNDVLNLSFAIIMVKLFPNANYIEDKEVYAIISKSIMNLDFSSIDKYYSLFAQILNDQNMKNTFDQLFYIRCQGVKLPNISTGNSSLGTIMHQLDLFCKINSIYISLIMQEINKEYIERIKSYSKYLDQITSFFNFSKKEIVFFPIIKTKSSLFQGIFGTSTNYNYIIATINEDYNEVLQVLYHELVHSWFEIDMNGYEGIYSLFLKYSNNDKSIIPQLVKLYNLVPLLYLADVKSMSDNELILYNKAIVIHLNINEVLACTLTKYALSTKIKYHDYFQDEIIRQFPTQCEILKLQQWLIDTKFYETLLQGEDYEKKLYQLFILYTLTLANDFVYAETHYSEYVNDNI